MCGRMSHHSAACCIHPLGSCKDCGFSLVADGSKCTKACLTYTWTRGECACVDTRYPFKHTSTFGSKCQSRIQTTPPPKLTPGQSCNRDSDCDSRKCKGKWRHCVALMHLPCTSLLQARQITSVSRCAVSGLLWKCSLVTWLFKMLKMCVFWRLQAKGAAAPQVRETRAVRNVEVQAVCARSVRVGCHTFSKTASVERKMGPPALCLMVTVTAGRRTALDITAAAKQVRVWCKCPVNTCSCLPGPPQGPFENMNADAVDTRL